MIRTIDLLGCEFEIDYEWDDQTAKVNGVSIDGNDITDILDEKALDNITEAIQALYFDDMADLADYAYQINKESRWAA